MTKIIKAKGKISRRLNCNLWGKANDPFLKKGFPAGQHGPRGYKKISAWGKQLIACQKFRFYYHIAERQLHKNYVNAVKMRGDNSENFVGLLERRLDAVVYRMNFAPTIFSAGQLVNHKHVLVNGKKVNIRSYLVRAGDIIELTEKARSIPLVMESLTKLERQVPEYLELEPKHFRGKFVRVPHFSEIPYAVIMEPSLVIERYSK